MGLSQPKLLEVKRMNSVDVIRLVYERFRPLTKSCGPLFAGAVTLDGNEGRLYLSEEQYWIWTSDEHSKELIHPEVDAQITPQELMRNLLHSTEHMLKAAEEHLIRIDQRAADVPSMLGYYLSLDAETMNDVFATRSFFTIESNDRWKIIKKSSKT